MASSEPDKEAGTSELVQETAGDSSGPEQRAGNAASEQEAGTPGSEQEMKEVDPALEVVDFFTTDWPKGRTPTYLDKEYANFLLRGMSRHSYFLLRVLTLDTAHHPEAKPHNKISKYFRFDEIYLRKCNREESEEEWVSLLKNIDNQANKLREEYVLTVLS